MDVTVTASSFNGEDIDEEDNTYSELPDGTEPDTSDGKSEEQPSDFVLAGSIQFGTLFR
jgi:hypothetical protein